MVIGNSLTFSGSAVPPAAAGKGLPWSYGGEVPRSSYTAAEIRISNQPAGPGPAGPGPAGPGQDPKVSVAQSKAKATRQR